MPDRKCSTCKHFEAAPMWKKGWCRNPLLYSPQQSHLVGDEDLDCNRGMGSYWEPIAADAGEPDARTRFAPPPPRTIAQASPGQQQETTERRTRPQRGGVEPITVRRQGADPVARPRSRPVPSAQEPLATETGEAYGPPEEQYAWGEYLRRSYPVIGILLLLGVFWVWSARQLSGNLPATPTIPLVAPTIAAPAAPPAVITPTAPVAPAASVPPSPAPGVIAPGARVVIKTAGGGANIRAQPTINGAVVTALDDGSALTITGPSQDADGYNWWPVQGDGFTGWVAGVLIEAAR